MPAERKRIGRRRVLQALAAAPVAAALTWTEDEAHAASRAAWDAREAARRQQARYAPKFFSAHEWATVSMLVDYILPKDARSGSATDAGVPEFMDFMMIDQPTRQSAMRGGLAWLDGECQRRHDKAFVACTGAERRVILDEISWPRRAQPAVSHGVSFFNSFRDLTASGFFTSKMGMDDLGYQGNTFVPDWNGCPPEVLKKLGIE
jgi:hypothetical protein